MIATQLRDMGYKDLKSPEQLKPKHIWGLVQKWQKEKITPKVIKNRMSTIRWVAQKTGSKKLVADNNAHYGIDKHKYVTNEDKSLKFTDTKINQIPDAHIRVSARLQREFGLRREEATKIMVGKADQGDRLQLEPSWCKGGHGRDIPIRTDEQRAALDDAKAFAGNASLIPPNLTYIQHIKIFERQMKEVGYGKSHGARHAYAQDRYRDLTSRECPALGGKTSKQLTPDEKKQDREARLTISREMGHYREQITAVYLGR